MAFLGQEQQIQELQKRFRFLYVALFIGLGALAARLVYLQILLGDQMRQYSEENRIKRVRIPAPRGMIFDRNRTLLVDNRPSFDLEIVPQYLAESRKSAGVISRLAPLIGMKETQVRRTLEKAKSQQAFLPVKIRTDLSRDEVARIESWKIAMPGVEIAEEIKRTHVHGDVASHLLGYIGEINSQELPLLNREAPKYHLGDSIGKFGLEQMLEDRLRGTDGEEILEVDALGRVRRDPGRDRMMPKRELWPVVPGQNLILTVDQDLQLAAAQAFGDRVGSVVAIDPRNGEILAMLSRPSFDPTDFSRGIPTALWSKLVGDPAKPLRDKSIQDHYPPGSTFKLVTAVAGLEEGVIDAQTHFNCPGWIKVGNRVFHCVNRRGHGDMNVVTALTHSCDVFFFRLAQKLKSVDQIATWAARLGLGKKTGIPLARETSGLVPTEGWKLKRHREQWNPGETLSVAIGQSYLLATTLQLANLYAAFGNGGTLYRPHLIRQIDSFDGRVIETSKPEILSRYTLRPETSALVKQGLWAVVNSPGGTAYRQRIPGVDFVGKSGTAQVVRMTDGQHGKCDSQPLRFRDDALFVGLAPAEDPLIAVAVVVEHGCSGSGAAAPIVRAVVKTYLEKYYPELYGEKVIATRLKNNPKPQAGSSPARPSR